MGDRDMSLSQGSQPPTAPAVQQRKVINRKPIARLQPESLQSAIGLQAVHDTFLDAFRARCKGPGHEVEDLGTIIGMYEAWQRRVYNYSSFDEFLKKVANCGKSAIIQDFLRDMRDNVAAHPKHMAKEIEEQENETIDATFVPNVDGPQDDELLDLQMESCNDHGTDHHKQLDLEMLDDLGIDKDIDFGP